MTLIDVYTKDIFIEKTRKGILITWRRNPKTSILIPMKYKTRERIWKTALRSLFRNLRFTESYGKSLLELLCGFVDVMLCYGQLNFTERIFLASFRTQMKLSLIKADAPATN